MSTLAESQQTGMDRGLSGRAAVGSALAALFVAGALYLAGFTSDYQVLICLVALVPALVIAVVRGWRRSVVALAAAMGALALLQVGFTLFGVEARIWPLLLGLVAIYQAGALASGWMRDVLDRERLRVEGRLGLIDAITGLPNERYALLFLRTEFAAARRGRPLAVVLFEVDGLREYATQHGTIAADEAVKAFTRVIARTTRDMNISARRADWRFLSVLSGGTAEDAEVFVKRTRYRLAEIYLPAGAITVSAGVATYRRGMYAPEDLVSAAESALGRARMSGPGGFHSA